MVKGPTGYTGSTGYTGYTGHSIIGYTGYTGYAGYTGYSIIGYTGPTGYTGYKGYTGYIGNSITGYTGYTGNTGYTGYYGPSIIKNYINCINESPATFEFDDYCVDMSNLNYPFLSSVFGHILRTDLMFEIYYSGTFRSSEPINIILMFLMEHDDKPEAIQKLDKNTAALGTCKVSSGTTNSSIDQIFSYRCILRIYDYDIGYDGWASFDSYTFTVAESSDGLRQMNQSCKIERIIPMWFKGIPGFYTGTWNPYIDPLTYEPVGPDKGLNFKFVFKPEAWEPVKLTRTCSYIRLISIP